MVIPASQLETWCNQGAITTAKATHESIRLALNDKNSPLKSKGFVEGNHFEIYLQGSYKNTTNIRGDSDVDVVVQLNQTFVADISEVTPQEQQLYKLLHQNATYQWNDFRADVLKALQLYYGKNNVDDTGNKSLKLKKTPGRLAADIVPSLQYRKYWRFQGIDEPFIEGMKFYTLKENRAVINYPKLHYQNGAYKNQNLANGCYKPVVRIFKNARTYMVERGIIPKDLAPSYFLEGFLYNVPNCLFSTEYQDSYCGIVTWLQQASLQSFLCQNEQLSLFGYTPEQWSISKAHELIDALIDLWNNW